MRARGKIPTGAHFIRNFVLNHPAYKQDSIVSNEIVYDLFNVIDSLEDPESLHRQKVREQLLGHFANVKY